MVDKPKCEQCQERDVFSKGLCSGCYGKKWRLEQKAKGEAAQPKQLTAGNEPDVIEGEIVDAVVSTDTVHLTALNPTEMQSVQGNLKPWLEDKLSVIERDIKEANQGLTEARNNGWSTTALTYARNRAVDDETYYNKILMAVEAGYTIIPDFPISVFAVRSQGDKRERSTFQGVIRAENTYLGRPVQTDCAPAGSGEYRNPQPETFDSVRENRTPGAQERGEPRYYTEVTRTGYPANPVRFPPTAARADLMQATAAAMALKAFDCVGICLPVMASGATRRVQENAGRAGDPLIIGQVVHKRIGSKQKVVSFIIGWYLNLNDL